MTDHTPLPVAGYTAQSADAIALVNELKQAEERYLRLLVKLRVAADTDKRLVALAWTAMQEANMWAVRAIFQSQRIKLPEDQV